MGFWSWLTGKPSAAEAAAVDLKVSDAQDVVTSLENISTNIIGEAEKNVEAAVVNINRVNGISLIGGPLVFDTKSLFTAASESIRDIQQPLQEDIARIQDFSSDKPNSVWATIAMAGVSLADGALTAIEELGDGVVTIFGYATGVDVSGFVEKELVHDKLLGGFYESDFAKRSAFTEDSFIAGALRFTGNVASSIFIGGAVGKAVTGSTKVVKTVKTARKIMALSEGIISGVSVTGAVTEGGLQAGTDFKTAAGRGMVAGAGIGVIAGALTGGALKKAEKILRSGDEVVGEVVEGGARGAAREGAEGAAREGAEELLEKELRLLLEKELKELPEKEQKLLLEKEQKELLEKEQKLLLEKVQKEPLEKVQKLLPEKEQKELPEKEQKVLLEKEQKVLPEKEQKVLLEKVLRVLPEVLLVKK